MVFCPACGTRNADGKRYCWLCGSALMYQPGEGPLADDAEPVPPERPVPGADQPKEEPCEGSETPTYQEPDAENASVEDAPDVLPKDVDPSPGSTDIPEERTREGAVSNDAPSDDACEEPRVGDASSPEEAIIAAEAPEPEEKEEPLAEEVSPPIGEAVTAEPAPDMPVPDGSPSGDGGTDARNPTEGHGATEERPPYIKTTASPRAAAPRDAGPPAVTQATVRRPSDTTAKGAVASASSRRRRRNAAASLCIIAIVLMAGVLLLLPTKYDVTVDIEGRGTVEGTGSYEEGTTVTLFARGQGGEEFYRWSDGVTTAKRTVVVDSDIRLTAYFGLFHDVDVDLSSPDSGTIAGKGGHIRDGERLTLTVSESYGYDFDHWEINGRSYSTSTRITVTVDGDMDIVAVMVPESFTVRNTVNNGSAGTVSGFGTFDYLTVTTLRATPNWGYEFTGWYTGDILMSQSSSYEFTVRSDTLIEARFSIKHDATFTLSDDSPVTGQQIVATGLYDVEISETSWSVTYTDTGRQVPVHQAHVSTGSYAFSWDEPCEVTLTRSVTYNDGWAASYSLGFVIDGTVARTFVWDFTYEYEEDHELLWGLIKWTTTETARETATYSLDMSLAEYVRYRDSLEPRYVIFVEDGEYVPGYKRGADPGDMVTYGDDLILRIASDFSHTTANLTDLERAQFVLNFVTKSIRYAYDIDTTGVREYYRYPYETLYEGVGDCEDTSFLFASIAKAMGYDVVLVVFPGHLLPAISVDGASGHYVEHGGKRYYYCETTADDGYWDIGGLSSQFVDQEYDVYTIP